MKKTTFKQLLAMLMAIAMLISVLPTISAADSNLVYVPDPAQWGTQNNNGWYYMFRLADGTYHEMNFYDSTSEIGWQQNNFASDPYTQGEMFFITNGACFVGENGTRPVYAFKAPDSGTIELRTQTHSTSEMRMQVYVEDQLQKINGEDSLTLTTTGTLPGAMTQTSLVLNVVKDQMVYVEFFSTDINAQRQAWINEYSVKYLSITEDLTGRKFAPDMGAWGTQNNNGWYYMVRDNQGNMTEMNYYDNTAEIDWQKDGFASDPYTVGEMYFLNRTMFFLGENGSVPVYAFKAPVGGEVELKFETHGTPDLYAKVLVNDEIQAIGEGDRVAFSTDGELEGFTATSLTLNVKKNTVIYIVPGNDDPGLANRGGWVRNYSVTFISTNEEVDYTAGDFAPDMSAWGTQNNNGWYYMYQHGTTGQYGVLNYYDETAEIDWQKNHYAFDPYTMGEMLFVEPNHFFLGENGSKAVYAFEAPADGQLKISFEIHGLECTGVSAFVDDELVQIEGKDRYTFTTSGTLEGAFTGVSFTTDVHAKQMVYLVCSTTDPGMRDGWFRNPSAKYVGELEVCTHDYQIDEEASVPATEFADGLTVYTCTNCGDTYSETIPATGCASSDLGMTDVKQGWYHEAVDFMVSNGYMKGKTSTTFAPADKMTRAELALLLYRISGEPDVEGTNPFPDVKDTHWAVKAIIWANQEGIIKGTDKGTFAPTVVVDRETVVLMLYRMVKGETPAEDNLASFPDADQVHSWTVDAMNWAVANSYINGTGKGELNPRGQMSRAEVAVLLYNYLSKQV